MRCALSSPTLPVIYASGNAGDAALAWKGACFSASPIDQRTSHGLSSPRRGHPDAEFSQREPQLRCSETLCPLLGA